MRIKPQCLSFFSFIFILFSSVAHAYAPTESGDFAERCKSKGLSGPEYETAKILKKYFRTESCDRVQEYLNFELRDTGFQFETNVKGERIQRQTLSLIGLGLSHLGFLAGLDELKVLNLRDNAIEDLQTLPPLVSLQSIDLANNKLRTIHFEKLGTKLSDLNLSQNLITGIAGLDALSELLRLNLSDNQITDIASLARLAKLSDVNVSSNEISDISPLSAIEKFAILNISKNRIKVLPPPCGSKAKLILTRPST